MSTGASPLSPTKSSLPIAPARRFPRPGQRWFGWGDACGVLKNDERALQLVKALEREGYLVGADDEPTTYQRTTLGDRLAMASARPLKRKTAERMLRDLVARAESVNANDDFCYDVGALVVFGSYLDETRHRLGDVDVGYVMSRRFAHGSEQAETAEGLSRARAEKANRIARALHAEEIGFAYHNHTFELARLPDGRTGYDVLLTETDPALVKFELDLFWATVAGHDPVEMLRRNPGRFAMWHVEDLREMQEAKRATAAAGRNAMQQMQAAMPRITAVGTGEIDFRRIFAEASVAGLQHFFVENDAAPDTLSSLADIETSYLNLRRMLS